MKKIATAVAGIVALAAVSPALAQEDPTFTGPRVEAILGYDITKAGSDVPDDRDPSVDGLVYGAGIGYDANLGNAVVGVEGEITDSTAKSKFNGTGIEDFGLGRVSTGRDLYVGARAGLLATPNTLLYVKGGYTNARFNVIGTDGTSRLRERFDTDGWRIGAGAERAIGTNSFAKLEYRYSNYSKGELDFENSNVPDSQRFNIDTDRHQVVAAVGYRF